MEISQISESKDTSNDAKTTKALTGINKSLHDEATKFRGQYLAINPQLIPSHNLFFA